MEELIVEHYPFKAGEKKEVILIPIFDQIYRLMNQLTKNKDRVNTLMMCINQHFHDSEAMFDYEEQARARGEVFATLFYHHRDHAVYQTTYDVASTLRAILTRGGAPASHLSQEGVMAALIGGMRHDNGFVTSPDSQNYAARSPIHVEEGMENVREAIKRIGLPPPLNTERVTELAVLGVHNTYFPYQEQHRAWMRSKVEAMTPNQRKEAHIVRLTVQFADLGGQVARIDYFPNLIKDLRQEMNAAQPGLGTAVIGEDHELAIKCRGFIKFMIQQTTVGKTGNAFFKTEDHSFSREWLRHASST